jgi:ABC-type xylose transport system permease subunit
VATVIVAMAWLGAAAAARRQTAAAARTIAVLFLIAPVVLSVVARQSSDQAWLGTAAVLLALAWFRPRRVGRGPGAAIAAAAAVVAMAVVGTAGPRHAWFDSAGIIYASRLRSVSTNIDGGTLVLYAVAAAVIGGTSLFGGRGKAIHAVLGGIVIAAIDNGMGLQGFSAAARNVVTAIVLIAAVTVDALARRNATTTR